METIIKEPENRTIDWKQRASEVGVKNDRVYLTTKRLFDIAFAVLGMIGLLPVMIILAIVIKCDSRGPVIFKQERLGLNGKPFIMYKFRSMRLDAEEDGPRWADRNDDRCTKIGRILRKTRVDELPQLVNILKGEMSFVGPRPERAIFYDKFEQYIPNFRDRLLMLPGLTGHAQVNGGYDLLPEEKIVYDMEYIRNCSYRMDLQCIFKTVQVIFSHNGAR